LLGTSLDIYLFVLDIFGGHSPVAGHKSEYRIVVIFKCGDFMPDSRLGVMNITQQGRGDPYLFIPIEWNQGSRVMKDTESVFHFGGYFLSSDLKGHP
jgi:hypothetical protein